MFITQNSVPPSARIYPGIRVVLSPQGMILKQLALALRKFSPEILFSFIFHLRFHLTHSHLTGSLLFDLRRTKTLTKVGFMHKVIKFPAFIFTPQTSLVST
jgi:hypothetical protein